MEDVKQYLHAGISKSTFGLETDRLLSEPKTAERERVISNFQDLFSVFFSKLNKYLEARPMYNFCKANIYTLDMNLIMLNVKQG